MNEIRLNSLNSFGRGGGGKIWKDGTAYGCVHIKEGKGQQKRACRALALGCGKHLSDLRQCWSDASSVQSRGEITFKDGDSASSDASCRGVARV